MTEDKRVWRYKEDGESRIFDSEDDVPKGEGWMDSPARPDEDKRPAADKKRAPQPSFEQNQKDEADAKALKPDAAPAKRADRPAKKK